MKKWIFLVLVLFSLGMKSQHKMRFFMQPEGFKASNIPYGDNAKAGRYAQSNDAKIYYEVYGSGDPIVILHGGGAGNMYEMWQFIDSLSVSNQVIAISTRGHGKSEIGTEPLTYEKRAEDVLAVVNKVTQKPVTIIGFSDGAYSGYKFASMYPERIKKLVAIGAGELTPGARKFNIQASGLAQFDAAFWQQQLNLMPEPKRVQEYFDQMTDMFNTIVVSKAFLATVKCPVLVLSGELDENAPLATIIDLYKMLPNSQLGIIPNAPHPVFIANFPAVWASIIPFLQES